MCCVCSVELSRLGLVAAYVVADPCLGGGRGARVGGGIVEESVAGCGVDDDRPVFVSVLFDRSEPGGAVVRGHVAVGAAEEPECGDMEALEEGGGVVAGRLPGGEPLFDLACASTT